MAAYDSLKSLVQQAIRTNGNNEITGQVLQNVLMAMIDELGGENGYAGVATPSTNPGAPDGKVFYFATEAGTYTHFDGATLAKGIHLLVFNGVTWSHQTLYTIDSEVTSGSNNLITSGAVYTKIINAINALNATVSKSAGADGLSLSLTETDGKVTSISGSIAPQTYDAYGAASAAQIAAATDATNKVNAAKTQILGDAASDYNTLGKLEDKIQAEASRAAAAESALNTEKANKATTLAGYGINDAYTKTEVNGLVSTPHQNYVTVPTYASLPATGSADTIYRVSNYNGSTSQVDASVYSEYAWNGSGYTFLRVDSQIGEVFDITVYNSNTKYADLAAALGTNGANVPSSIRRGGMSVKFVQSSDNNYIQARCIANEFTTDVTKWQGVDDEPTAGSDNLVKSGGVSRVLFANIGTIINGTTIHADTLLFDNTHVSAGNNISYKIEKVGSLSAIRFYDVSDNILFTDSISQSDPVGTQKSGIYTIPDNFGYCKIVWGDTKLLQLENTQIQNKQLSDNIQNIRMSSTSNYFIGNNDTYNGTKVFLIPNTKYRLNISSWNRSDVTIQAVIFEVRSINASNVSTNIISVPNGQIPLNSYDIQIPSDSVYCIIGGRANKDVFVNYTITPIITSSISKVIYNMTSLYPTSGLDGGNKYNLELAVSVLNTNVPNADYNLCVTLSFEDASGYYHEYIKIGNSNNVASWIPSEYGLFSYLVKEKTTGNVSLTGLQITKGHYYKCIDVNGIATSKSATIRVMENGNAHNIGILNGESVFKATITGDINVLVTNLSNEYIQVAYKELTENEYQDYLKKTASNLIIQSYGNSATDPLTFNHFSGQKPVCSNTHIYYKIKPFTPLKRLILFYKDVLQEGQTPVDNADYIFTCSSYSTNEFAEGVIEVPAGIKYIGWFDDEPDTRVLLIKLPASVDRAKEILNNAKCISNGYHPACGEPNLLYDNDSGIVYGSYIFGTEYGADPNGNIAFFKFPLCQPEKQVESTFAFSNVWKETRRAWFRDIMMFFIDNNTKIRCICFGYSDQGPWRLHRFDLDLEFNRLTELIPITFEDGTTEVTYENYKQTLVDNGFTLYPSPGDDSQQGSQWAQLWPSSTHPQSYNGELYFTLNGTYQCPMICKSSDNFETIEFVKAFQFAASYEAALEIIGNNFHYFVRGTKDNVEGIYYAKSTDGGSTFTILDYIEGSCQSKPRTLNINGNCIALVPVTKTDEYGNCLYSNANGIMTVSRGCVKFIIVDDDDINECSVKLIIASKYGQNYGDLMNVGKDIYYSWSCDKTHLASIPISGKSQVMFNRIGNFDSLNLFGDV